MALTNGWKGTTAAMLAGGAIGLFLAPILTPAIARLSRPAAKAAVRAGMMIYARGRVVAAELRETVEDVTAEVQAEFAAEQSAAHPGETTRSGLVH